jgi:hypothetical protein
VLHNGHSLEATGSLRIGGLDCAPKRARRCQYGRGLMGLPTGDQALMSGEVP